MTEGQYLLNGKNIEEYSEKQMARLRNEMFGFVVQDFALIERYISGEKVMRRCIIQRSIRKIKNREWKKC